MTDTQKARPDQYKPPSFQETVSRMFSLLVARNGSHQDAKKILIDWYEAKSTEDKAQFKSDQEAFQMALKRCEGAIDTIRQEAQMLMHRFEAQ